MRSTALLCAFLACASAQASDATDVVEGKAVAASVMAGPSFNYECQAKDSTPEGRLLCAMRSIDIEKGARFMGDLYVWEAKNRKLKEPEKFLKMKQFSEKAYDDCITRRLDDTATSPAMRTEDAICALARADTLEGMRLFVIYYSN